MINSRPFFAIPRVGYLMVFGLLACGEGGDSGALPAEAFVVRDSAGIRIVENEWPEGGPATVWRAEDVPIVRIGELAGVPEYLLHRVDDVLRLEDGRIVIVNARTELRFYDPGGEHLLTVGGQGEGPGEFLWISGLALARDTLFVYDGHQYRVSFFDTEGTYLGGNSDFTGLIGMTYGPLKLSAAPSGGRFVFLYSGFSVPRRDPVEIFWATMPILAVSRDGSHADTLGVMGMDWVTGNQEVLPPPFGRMTSASASTTRLVTTHGARFEVEQRDVETGELVRLIRLRRDPPALRASEFKDALKERAAQNAKAQIGSSPAEVIARKQEILESLGERVTPYETKPAWTDLFLDSEGFIWAEEPPEPGASMRTFTVFDEEGHLIAGAQIPRSLRIRQIGRDFVLGVIRDEMDVEYVQLLRLNRRLPATRVR